MPDLLYFVICGAGVGLAVGLTGVGGGSLMTPLLIFSGIPTKVAIGTDLLYAAATKGGALLSHQRQKSIKWKVVFLLLSGSIPASLLTSAALRYLISADANYSAALELALGIMLLLTSIVVVFKSRIRAEAAEPSPHNQWLHKHRGPIAVLAGVLLGVFVTLSSVGAGAFCTALLLTLYPRLPALNVIGTDIAHAVPLTLVAGMGHLWNDNISWSLLAGLLIGSLPAVHLGAKLAARIPNHLLQRFLAFILFGIGLKFVFIS
ncbi:sulfite exporter TauE/SafE family protein [Agaribacterium haliotis]|uniref:sulfite exporter TauE/SafE family protein n=1 Tax=Agaribacterium haliotis TaxID=2013869 RepID=UPI000BB567F1|nr:sulfite exporter TauE/SafE family protein [Agaribacterium haliotis]